MKLEVCPGHPCPSCKVDYGCLDNLGTPVRFHKEPYERLPDGNLRVKCRRGMGTPRECLQCVERRVRERSRLGHP